MMMIRNIPQLLDIPINYGTKLIYYLVVKPISLPVRTTQDEIYIFLLWSPFHFLWEQHNINNNKVNNTTHLIRSVAMILTEPSPRRRQNPNSTQESQLVPKSLRSTITPPSCLPQSMPNQNTLVVLVVVLVLKLQSSSTSTSLPVFMEEELDPEAIA